MEKKDYNKSYKRLIHRFTIATTLLLFVFIAKQLIVRHQINQEINTSHIINIAGRQRMLSQKITKDIIFIGMASPESSIDTYSSDLGDSLKLWKKSHYELLALNKKSGKLASENKEISQMYKDLEVCFFNIADGAEHVLHVIKNGEELFVEIDQDVKKVLENEPAYLEKMDNIVLKYEKMQ